MNLLTVRLASCCFFEEIKLRSCEWHFDFEVNIGIIEQYRQRVHALCGKLVCLLLLPSLAAFSWVFRVRDSRAGGENADIQTLSAISPQCFFSLFSQAHRGWEPSWKDQPPPASCLLIHKSLTEVWTDEHCLAPDCQGHAAAIATQTHFLNIPEEKSSVVEVT